MKTLDLNECAEYLKIERTHALTLAGSGVLPGAKIGRSWVFLEEDLVEYLRTEVRKQMRERQVKTATKETLAESIARNPPMVTMVSPRAAARAAKKRPRIDLSGYNDDGTPKTLSELTQA